MTRLLIICFLSITSILAATASKNSIEIYTNIAFVHKTYGLETAGNISTLVPYNIALENMRYNFDKQCEIIDTQLSKTIKDQDAKYDSLQDEKRKLQNAKNALALQEKLLQSITLEKSVDVQNIKSVGEYAKSAMSKLLEEKDTLTDQIKAINEEIQDLSPRTYKKLNISYICKDPSSNLTVSYPQTMQYKMLYDFNAKVLSNEIEITSKASINYKGFEDFSQTDIRLHTYAHNSYTAPIRFTPKYLGVPIAKLKARTSAMSDSMELAQSAPAPISYEEHFGKSSFFVQNTSLYSGKEKNVELKKESLPATFTHYIDAYGTSKAYMQANFTPKRYYQGAQSSFMVEGNTLAKRYVQPLQKEQKAKLYFGQDQDIRVEKELIKTLNEKTFFGDKRIETQNWKYIITNTKTQPVQIEFVERTPVSKNADIVVKTTAQPDFTKQDANGKTLWVFELGMKSAKEIIFGYEVAKE